MHRKLFGVEAKKVGGDAIYAGSAVAMLVFLNFDKQIRTFKNRNCRAAAAL